jgi:hypothetical protein
MLDSDGSDSYIGEQQIKEQEEQSTEIVKNEILQTRYTVLPIYKPKMKLKLLKIINLRGHPNFHFEIDGKSYFYEIEGIKADYKIVLRCTKRFLSLSCDNLSCILPSDFLKQIIQNSPKISEYPKFFDKSESRMFDINNYDINSFEIGNGHNCSGKQPDTYPKKNTPKNNTPVKCKLLKIENRRGHPIFHFEINGKMYCYGIRGIRANYKIVLRCYKMAFGSQCNNISTILPSDFLKQIIQDTPDIGPASIDMYHKYFDKSDRRVYNLNNYDVNSFDIGKGHKCSGTELEEYNKIHEKVKCRLVKIAHGLRGGPTSSSFHFEINEKMYFYRLEGITADNRFCLYCHACSTNGSICKNKGNVIPTESLKQLIKRSPKNSKFPNYLDKSDPRVYDIDIYDINALESRGDHNHPGMELDEYFKNIFPIENEMF